jgi:hypothetical protein
MTEKELETGHGQGTKPGIPAVVDIDPAKVASPALRQLLEEVRSEDTACAAHHYNRVYNKHNR